MTTPNYNLPTISGNMTADVVRDMNALAEAADSAIKEAIDNVDLSGINTKLDIHIVDYVKHPGYGVTTFSSPTYSVTLSPAPTQYIDGMGLVLRLNSDQVAGNAAINVNGLGAKIILNSKGFSVTNLKKDVIYSFRYSAAKGAFILQGEGGAGDALASDLLSGKKATTDAGDIVGTMPNRGAPTITPNTSDQSIPQGYYSGGTIKAYPDVLYKTNVEIPSGSTVYLAPRWGLAATMFAMLEKVGEINDSASVNFTSQKETGSGVYFPQKGNNLEVGYASFNSSLSLKSSYGGTHLVIMAKRI